MANFDRLNDKQIQMLRELLDYHVLWGDDDVSTPERRTTLKQLIKRGILAWDKEDDNGGEIYWTREVLDMMDQNDPSIPEWILEEFFN